MSTQQALSKLVDRLVTAAAILALPILALVAWNALRAAPEAAKDWSQSRQRRLVIDSIIQAADWAQANEGGATFIEFVDYECPACKSVETLVTALTERTSARVIVLQYPLESIHVRAYGAAKAAVCAAQAGAFLPFHRALFQNGLPASDSDYVSIAKSVGVSDALSFELCRTGRAADSVIANHAAIAFRLGVGGTPTFFDTEGRIVALSSLLTAATGANQQ